MSETIKIYGNMYLFDENVIAIVICLKTINFMNFDASNSQMIYDQLKFI